MNESLLTKEEQELEFSSKNLKENFERILEDFHKLYDSIREAISIREAEVIEKMKQILQNELNNIENKHTANQKQLCI